MKQNSLKQGIASVLIVFGIIGILFSISAIREASEPRCIKKGCNNAQSSDSSYCYLHQASPDQSSAYENSSYNSKSSNSSSETYSKNTSNSYSDKSTVVNNSSYNSSMRNSTTTKNNAYNSYDDGYDAIYMDGDYDYDRYDTDSDYADGVDDAMDEFEED
mgnify:FL=1